jgi:N-acetylglucosaminyldiphosphoundecaprenol N-acetyl-beta-D-mannosaminyltransferase
VDNTEAVNLLGLRVGILSVDSLVDFITRTIHTGGKARVVYVNISAVNLAQDLAWFRDFINKSDIAYCDGFGVKWGARLLGLRIPYRYTPPDWIKTLAEECTRQHFSLYLLGSHPGVAEKVGVILKQQSTNLTIAGTHHGFFEKAPNSIENEAVLQAINTTKPDILLVGFGMPLQERWLMENWDRLEIKVALPVGALFDYLAGEIPRAPHWMTDHGLEWLGRLIVEPRRLWRRYLLGNPRFLWLVLKERLRLLRDRREGIIV